jgi:RHS repeat-associated protein
MTPLYLTDESQSIVWQAEYYPFGKIYSESGSVENKLRFPGQYYEQILSNSNIYYNGFRWYKTNIGRYVSPDSFDYFSYLTDENLYFYSENNPSNKYDITGHYVIDESCRCKEKYNPFEIHKAIRKIKLIRIPRKDVRACVDKKFDYTSNYKIFCGGSCQRNNEGYWRGSEEMGLCPLAFEEGHCGLVATLVEEALHSCFWSQKEVDEIIGDILNRCIKYGEKK